MRRSNSTFAKSPRIASQFNSVPKRGLLYRSLRVLWRVIRVSAIGIGRFARLLFYVATTAGLVGLGYLQWRTSAQIADIEVVGATPHFAIRQVTVPTSPYSDDEAPIIEIRANIPRSRIGKLDLTEFAHIEIEKYTCKVSIKNLYDTGDEQDRYSPNSGAKRLFKSLNRRGYEYYIHDFVEVEVAPIEDIPVFNAPPRSPFLPAPLPDGSTDVVVSGGETIGIDKFPQLNEVTERMRAESERGFVTASGELLLQGKVSAVCRNVVAALNRRGIRSVSISR